MKPIWAASFVVLVMAPTTFAGRWREFKVDLKAEATTESMLDSYLGEPDFLTPAENAEGRRHNLLARFVKIFSLSDTAWTVEMVHTDDKKSVVLELYRWTARPEMDTRKKVGEVPVDLALANEIYRVWVNTLLEVRYSRDSAIGLDGTTYHFAAWAPGPGWLHGETWSPDLDAPPKRLVSIGEDLIKMVQGTEAERPVIAKRVLDNCKWVMSYLKRHAIIVPTNRRVKYVPEKETSADYEIEYEMPDEKTVVDAAVGPIPYTLPNTWLLFLVVAGGVAMLVASALLKRRKPA